MKKFLILSMAGALLALGSLPAAAQQYGALATLVSGGIVTSGMDNAASYTSNYTAVGVTKYDQIYISVTASGSNTTSGQFFIPYSLSGDGVNYATTGPATNYFIVACTTAGVPVTYGTNITVGAAGYFKSGIIGATNTVLTNVTYKVWVKPRRNG